VTEVAQLPLREIEGELRDGDDAVCLSPIQAIRIRGEGEAKAAELLPVFELNPALANFDLRLKALEQSLKEKSTLIFDQRTPPFDLFQGFATNRPSK
jgi:hypothetical protein